MRGRFSALAYGAVLVIGCSASSTSDAPGAGTNADAAHPVDATADNARACKELVAQRPLGCATWTETSATLDLPVHLTGTVEEIVRGPWGCGLPLGDFYYELGERPWRARVKQGGDELWVGFYLPWQTPLVAVGDVVSVDYQAESQAFGPSRSNLVLRAEDDSLIAWVGLAAGTHELMTPDEIGVGDSEEECVVDDDGCGTFARRAFLINAGDDRVPIAYGKMRDVGDFAVLHAGNDHQLQAAGCPDWFVARSSLAAIRGSIEGLTQRDRGPCGKTACAAGQFCLVPENATCDRHSPEAVCEDVADTCPADCPGVCGCDGRFYCNGCRAAKAGVDVAAGDERCMTPRCKGEGLVAGCKHLWSCYGQNYESNCGVDGRGRRICTCLIDMQVVDSFEATPELQCLSDETALKCGFPPNHP